jgi:hypothetical protein
LVKDGEINRIVVLAPRAQNRFATLMKTARLATRTLQAALLIFGLVLAPICPAQDAPATSFIVPKPDRQCDEFNRSWKITNTHSYLSIKVTVRWHAVGAKEMQEEFILTPGQSRGIGCAPSIEIVAAEIMQF